MTRPVTRGHDLARLTWPQAEALLTPDAVVVIPLGAATKEHGPHLPLNTDWLQAEHHRAHLVEAADVVVLPTVPYSFFPAFTDYPGSVSLDAVTAERTVSGICDSIARHGPRRFYCVNLGISTNGPLRAAAASLAQRGVLLHFTDLTVPGPVKAALAARQLRGSHADLVETSVMLAIAPDVVDMRLAVADMQRDAPGGLVRDATRPGVWSASGVWGDPTGATAEAGAAVVAETQALLLADIDALRRAPLPSSTAPPP